MIPSEFSKALEGLAKLGGVDDSDEPPYLQATGASDAGPTAPSLDASKWFDSNLPPAHEQPEAVNLRASDNDPESREAHAGLPPDDAPLPPLPVFDNTGEIPRVPPDVTPDPPEPYTPPPVNPQPPPPTGPPLSGSGDAGDAAVRGCHIQRADWYAEELIGRAYTRCEFIGVDLTESTIRGCTFSDCTFRDTRFNASAHADSAFIGCTFAGCNFFDAQFDDCKLTGSRFERCSLRPLRALGGDWSFVVLAAADLRGCSFQGVRMREADLSAANCADAVFADVDLSGAALDNVQFSRADLRGSDLSALDPLASELSGALIRAEQAVVIAQAVGLSVR